MAKIVILPMEMLISNLYKNHSYKKSFQERILKQDNQIEIIKDNFVNSFKRIINAFYLILVLSHMEPKI